MKNQERGLFIVLEGLDKCGKTTQTKLLTERLQAEKMNFPNRTTGLGTIISSYLKGSTEMKDEVIHLLFSANRWEMSDEIKNTLMKGQHIVCDRYAYSGVAFSSAKGLSIDWCKKTDIGLPKPDLVIFLKGSMEELSKRGDYGAERYENERFQEKVNEKFQELIESDNIIIVDAMQKREEVQNDILGHVFEKMRNIGELGKLWIE